MSLEAKILLITPNKIEDVNVTENRKQVFFMTFFILLLFLLLMTSVLHTQLWCLPEVTSCFTSHSFQLGFLCMRVGCITHWRSNTWFYSAQLHMIVACGDYTLAWGTQTAVHTYYVEYTLGSTRDLIHSLMPENGCFCH